MMEKFLAKPSILHREVFEMGRSCLFWLIATAVWSENIRAEDKPSIPAAAARDVDFVKDIQPLLKDHCVKCHGASKQRGDLRLDDKKAAMKGGESFAPAIIPGNGADSPLVRFTAGIVDGMQMPPEGEKKMTNDEIGLLRAWIDQGAKWPDEPGRPEETVEHWSFQPLRRPAVPIDPAAPSIRAQNPIDPFVEAKLPNVSIDPSGAPSVRLTPSTEADRVTLIRRATLDLTGLPATLEELAEFQQEASPDAFERLIDRLMASPHFGERWARHWLDVVKFAESDGFETNQPRPNAWPYRDYVIRAFNDDKTVDRFLFEQLAGDTVGVDEATGFLVAGAWDRVKSPDPGLTAQQRADELHDMVSTTGSAFIGLTVGCARCHNHKFDPISQSDYYAIKAVFAGVQHGERPLKPADFEQRQQIVDSIRTKLAIVDQELANFEPMALVSAKQGPTQPSDTATKVQRATLLLDDEPAVLASALPRDVSGLGAESDSAVQGHGMWLTAVSLIAPKGQQPYGPGTAKGELSDPGDSSRFPNLGRSYSYWNDVANRDVFTWNPGAIGRWHIWLSWGCGWETHATDVRYLLDLDGDLSTVADQKEIARVDQRSFADGSSGTEGQSLWSGFFDAGIHSLKPFSRIILRGGETAAYVTADLICLQEASAEVSLRNSSLPRLRPSVQRQTNVERFLSTKARFVRFEIDATTGSEPCLDEIEVFETRTNSATKPKNVALSSLGTTATSSSSLPGFEIHQLAFVNDGRYGNSASWISNEPGRGWVMLEFAEPIEIDRVLWSRDRPDNGQFQDRIPTKYRIEAGLTKETMQVVASSDDRLPPEFNLTALPVVSGLGPDEQRNASRRLAVRDSLRQRLQSLSMTAVVYAGRFSTPEATHRLHRGDPLQPKEATLPGGLDEFGSPWKLTVDSMDADRRRALGNWIISLDHPLTARVMVNRLWQFHFGQGLVSTPSDFGRNGFAPSHPELLNWLATEMQSGVAPKKLHRLMMTSATYRQSSEVRDDAMQVDAATLLLWRYPPRRLEAEAIRDAILAVSGNLDDRMYGPGFDLFHTNTNYVKVYNSKREMGPAEWRRMVYQSKPRMQLDEIFGQFDCPDAGQIAPKRTSSITALQALNLLNSRFILQQSAIFSNRLREEAGQDPAAQIRRGFQLAFHREPSDEELASAMQLVLAHGLDAFCRAALNANEFLFVF